MSKYSHLCNIAQVTNVSYRSEVRDAMYPKVRDRTEWHFMVVPIPIGRYAQITMLCQQILRD